MKFIFPQNYNFKNKLLGFIDYSTLFFNILWGSFIYFISSIFSTNLSFKISFFIILFFPVLLFSIFGFNHEKITYILRYIMIFTFSPKYYIYKK